SDEQAGGGYDGNLAAGLGARSGVVSIFRRVHPRFSPIPFREYAAAMRVVNSGVRYVHRSIQVLLAAVIGCSFFTKMQDARPSSQHWPALLQTARTFPG